MMKFKILTLWFILVPFLHGQTSKELLRDGLFAEESEGDLKTATEKYEALLKAFEAERKVAAVALFRLATVKRKQGEDKAALALYEEFGKKFANIEPQATLVRENYLAISGKAFPNGSVGLTAEDEELARVQKLKLTSPDLFPNLPQFGTYASKGWTKVIDYLLKEGANPGYNKAFTKTVGTGNLAMVELLLSGEKKPGQEQIDQGLQISVLNRHWTVAAMVASHGATLKGSAILTNPQCYDLDSERIRQVVQYGANIDYPEVPPLLMAAFQAKTTTQKHWSIGPGVTPYAYTKALLKAGADVEAASEREGVRAFHCAAWVGDETSMQILIEAGADIDAMTNNPPEGGWTFNTFSLENHAYAPIDLAPLETVPFLLKAGAKVTHHVFERAFNQENFDLIPSLVEAGVNLNRPFSGGELPLNCALKVRQPNLVDLFLKQGADLEKADWRSLTPELRIKYAHKYIYPTLTDSTVVSVVVPESRERTLVVQKVKLQENFYRAFLEISLPDDFRLGVYDFSIDIDRLTWKLFRNGEASIVDLTKFPLPGFQKGDILEITGLDGNGSHRSDNQLGEKLRNRSGSKIPVNFLKSSRFPFQVTLEEERWDLLLCPDRWFYDARTKEIPEAKLGTILRLLERNSIDPGRRTPRTVIVHRKGTPDLRFIEKDGAMDQFEIKEGDHIEIKEIEGSSEKKGEGLKTRSIRARVPGIPGGWIWEVQEAPDLLALLADINIGLHEEFLIKGGIPTSNLDESSFQKILPGIDLGNIIVKRAKDGMEEEININLEEAISAWEKAGRTTEAVGYQMEAGDELILTTREDGEPGFSELAHSFLQAALNVTIIYEHRTGSRAWTLPYHQSRWASLPRGIFPILKAETVPSVRGDRLFSPSGPISTRRNNKLNPLRSMAVYWPEQGDYLVEVPGEGKVPGVRSDGRRLLQTPLTYQTQRSQGNPSRRKSKTWPLLDGEKLDDEVIPQRKGHTVPGKSPNQVAPKRSSTKSKRNRYVPRPKK